MALFTLQEILARLTRGFVKVTGRQPEGLDKIKIKQEALKKFMEQNKVVDMKGRVIDQSKGIMGGQEVGMFDNIFNRMQNEMRGLKSVDDRPPPGSRGGKDDIAAPVQSAEETLKDMIQAENKKNIAAMRNRKMIKDAVDNVSPGFVKGDRKYNAQLVAEELAEKKFGKEFYDLDQKQQMDLYGEALDGLSVDLEDFAQGGVARIGYKKGSIDLARRGFMKAAAGVGAGLGALKMGALKLFGKEGTRQVTKQIIKTDNVAGKPEWFDQLVNKVILEGDDMTKQFATKEREIVHAVSVDEDSFVKVTQDLDEGVVRVEYESPENVYGDPVQMQYKKPNPDEGNPKPGAEFDTAESGPVGRAFGPDDYEIEIDELGGTSISDLTSDVSKLKEYATGQKPTLKEIVQSKKRKDKAKRISEGGEDEMQAVIDRQGEYIQYDDVDPEPLDFARGGIARMLGE